MSFCFWPSTGSARFNIIHYKLSDIGPSILPLNDWKSFVDSKMSRDWMIIKTLKDAEPKISGLWNKSPLINPDESYIIYRPTQIFGVVGICTERLYSWVSIINSQNVLLKLLNIHSNNTTESYQKQCSGSERSGQLSRRKNRMTILWIDCTIRLSLPFWIEVRPTSKCVGFCSKAARTESNNHIKSGQKSRPPSLSPG
jgi:hypothetical protein